jgi:transposase
MSFIKVNSFFDHSIMEVPVIRIEFTETDVQELKFWRYHHPHPRVQQKMETLWLKSKGLAHKEIARITGLSINIVTQYIKAYQEGGIEKLKEIHFHQPQSELAKHTETIEVYFKEHPPATIKEAMQRIEDLTGIKRSEVQISKFLKSIGVRRRKVGTVPAKADIEKQETFKKNTGTTPRRSQTREANRILC